jgi:hypothetical protein
MISFVLGGRIPQAATSRDRRPRYDVERPIRYRPLNGADWVTGTTVNVSGTGVLFHGDLPLPAGVEIELEIALNGAWAKGGNIRATARTVRLLEFAPPARSVVAARFITSSLVPPDGR